jgi:hypothetical protein
MCIYFNHYALQYNKYFLLTEYEKGKYYIYIYIVNNLY